MIDWFQSKSPGARAGLTMVGGCFTVVFLIALVWLICAWIGWKLLWLIPLGVVIYIIGKLCQGLHFVWAFLTDEFEQGDRSRKK